MVGAGLEVISTSKLANPLSLYAAITVALSPLAPSVKDVTSTPPILVRSQPTTMAEVATILSGLPSAVALTTEPQGPLTTEPRGKRSEPNHHNLSFSASSGPTLRWERQALALAEEGRTVVVVEGLPEEGMVGWRIEKNGRRRATRLRCTPHEDPPVVVARLGRTKVPNAPSWPGPVYAEGGSPLSGWPPGWKPISAPAST